MRGTTYCPGCDFGNCRNVSFTASGKRPPCGSLVFSSGTAATKIEGVADRNCPPVTIPGDRDWLESFCKP